MLGAVSVGKFEVVDRRANRRRRRQVAGVAAAAGDGRQSDDHERREDEINRILLLHVSVTPFENGWRLNAKISSEKLDVASRGLVRKKTVAESVCSFPTPARQRDCRKRDGHGRRQEAILTKMANYKGLQIQQPERHQKHQRQQRQEQRPGESITKGCQDR